MRILIDLQGAQSITSRCRGIGRYSMALSLAMARNAGGHEIWLVLNGAFADTIISVRKAFDGIIPPDRIRCFSALTGLPAVGSPNVWRTRSAELIRESFLADLQPDVVFVSSLFEGAEDNCVTSVGLQEPDIATAVTLYDLIPFMNRDSYLGDPVLRAWYDGKIESLTRARLLLSISEYGRQEAMQVLNLPGHKVVNISSAASGIFQPVSLTDEDLQALLTRYELDRPFIMHNGAFEARKNLDRLIEAYAQLPASIREGNSLLLVGKAPEVDRKRLLKLAYNRGVLNQVRLPGYVPDEDLVALYSQCALFVFPSLQEGFGLPALEAMACGAATIGSNTSSIPEVIAFPDALFDPTDSQSIAAKMEQVLTDDNLYRQLCKHGRAQAAKFSWETSAKLGLTAFEQISAFNKRNSLLSLNEKKTGRKVRCQRLISSLAKLPGRPENHDLKEIALAIDRNRYQTQSFPLNQDLPESIRWRIEGPFDSSYSLALLNRETARALSALGHEVSLHSTEGPGDFLPNPEFLKANPDLAAMHALSAEIHLNMCQVVSRNLYPPRVTDMAAPLNLLHHYAWEESGFPLEWIDQFNQSLQGITCLSRHVEKILINHGITVPLVTSGCGVDHWQRFKADENFRLKAKAFRFLHVSSCFPRKGADALLDAYGRSFTDNDDVTLVIKTFVNPHNEIRHRLAERRQAEADFPDVVILEEDMADACLKALYQQCHCMVAPSRAEGFGLPMAEAMLCGLPVITTAWGGQMDFCNNETAWLIDYSFVRAKTHFNLYDSVWAEPDVSHLAQTMREIYEMPASLRRERPAMGSALLFKQFNWRDVVGRLVAAARVWARMPAAPKPRIGWVTTWNTRCGIASYSAYLIDHLPGKVTILACHADDVIGPDGPEVRRCWTINGHAEQSTPLDQLAKAIDEQDLDTLVIQFNYSFFHLENLSSFLFVQLAAGRRIVLMLHSTVDRPDLPQGRLATLVPALAKCYRICVHSVADLNHLKALGLVDNVTLFPLGILDYTPKAAPPVATDRPRTIASYGFFLPHKGLLELIEAVAILRRSGDNVRLLMVNARYPVPQSDLLIKQARVRIEELGIADRVRIISEYLSDEESLAHLAEADLIVFPYQNTGESASAAVRHGLASGRPVAVTPISFFDDVAPVVSYLPGLDPEMIARGVKSLLTEILNNSRMIREKKVEVERWRKERLYSRLGQRLFAIL